MGGRLPRRRSPPASDTASVTRCKTTFTSCSGACARCKIARARCTGTRARCTGTRAQRDGTPVHETWRGKSTATRGLTINELYLKQVESHLAEPPLPVPAPDPSAQTTRIPAADSRMIRLLTRNKCPRANRAASSSKEIPTPRPHGLGAKHPAESKWHRQAKPYARSPRLP